MPKKSTVKSELEHLRFYLQYKMDKMDEGEDYPFKYCCIAVLRSRNYLFLAAAPTLSFFRLRLQLRHILLLKTVLYVTAVP